MKTGLETHCLTRWQTTYISSLSPCDEQGLCPREVSESTWGILPSRGCRGMLHQREEVGNAQMPVD